MSVINSLQQKLAENEVDGLLIASGINRRYATGFTGSAGALLLTENEALFITDFRYTEQATEQVGHCKIIKQNGTLAQEIANQAKTLNIKRLGFEKNKVTYAEYEMYQDLLPEVDLVPVSQLVESLRLIKTEEEIAIMKKAAQIADEAFSYIQSVIKPGIAEIDISNELEFFMRKQGLCRLHLILSSHRVIDLPPARCCFR